MNEIANSVGLLKVEEIRAQFPVLGQQVNGHPLVYLDNAATTQKPQSVINELVNYYQGYNANIHRGNHSLAERATSAFEQTRIALQQFVNAPEAEEIIFTKGTTEGINLVASTFGRSELSAGDEILITGMEHHSNIVPWQLLCKEKNAKLKVVPVNSIGEIDLEEAASMITQRTRILAVCYASNALGTINPVKELIDLAHQAGAVVVIDAAQAMPHLHVDVQHLNCDFLAASAHKMYGPTGIGFLYGKRKWLEKMPPYQGGGEMIREVSFQKTTYNDIPYKFEAGTPNIADVIGFNRSVEFLLSIGRTSIAAYENDLIRYATSELEQIHRVTLVGTAKNKVSVLSFNIDGIHPFDVGMMLDARGIAVRTGHHCTMPLMDHFGLEGTVRASFALYNTRREVDYLAESLDYLIKRKR